MYNINYKKYHKELIIGFILLIVGILLTSLYMNFVFKGAFKKLFLDNEVEAIYQKCLQNGFKEENLKETIHTTLILIESFVHDKTFNKSSYIDYEKQKLFITQTLLRLWSLHI